MLSVVNTMKGGKALRDRMSREKYFAMIACEIRDNAAEHPYRALCPKCLRVYTLEQLGKQRLRKQVQVAKPLVVWHSTLNRIDTFMRHRWLDTYVESGYEAFVLWEKSVRAYGVGTEGLSRSWQEFAEAEKVSKVTPGPGTTVYER
jgi:hypothetical protein